MVTVTVADNPDTEQTVSNASTVGKQSSSSAVGGSVSEEISKSHSILFIFKFWHSWEVLASFRYQ